MTVIFVAHLSALLWTPDSPALHSVVLVLCVSDELLDMFDGQSALEFIGRSETVNFAVVVWRIVVGGSHGEMIDWLID